jgi:hypothetical protein
MVFFHILFLLLFFFFFFSFIPTPSYGLRSNNIYNLHMWGYLLATFPQHLPLLQPTIVPPTTSFSINSTLKIVNNGQCEFTLTIYGT